MTAFSLLMILVGIFILLNAANFLKVLKGEADINFLQPDKGKTTGTTGTTGDNSTPGSVSSGGGGAHTN